MEVKLTPFDNATLVEIRGRIVDGAPAQKLHDALRTLVREKKPNTIFDLAEVDWFDSTAIGLLVSHYVSVSKLGGRVAILNANDRVKTMMRMVRLDDRFGWAQVLEEALSWLEEPSR